MNHPACSSPDRFPPRLRRHLLPLVILLACAAAARGVTLVNQGFELPVQAPGGFTGTLVGWTNPGTASDSFVEYIAGFKAEGNQHLGMNLNTTVRQDPGVPYAASTVYRLQVAAGNRAGYSAAGNLSTYRLTEPGATATITGSYDAFTNVAAGAFADAPPLFVSTAATPALVGKTIRIQLSALGAGRSHFDKVRLDSGTVADFTTVTTTSDSGPGSLREALVVAALVPGADTITFAPALAGQTIPLASGIAVADGGGVTLDASALTGGVTLTDTGNVTYRLLSLTSGSLTLRGLTLRDGSGGAISQNSGTTLALTDCSVIGNSTTLASGGGILSFGPLTLTRCTFSGNSTGSSNEGGAVRSENAAFTAIQCTFTGNTAKIGGACSLAGTGAVVLTHCTIAGNFAVSDANNNGGGGLYFYDRGATLRNCLIAGNTSGFNGGTDLEADTGVSTPTFTTQSNLIGSNKSVTSQFPAGSPNAQGNFVGSESTPLAPGLASLADNGGGTRTMALLPGSPAIDAGTVLSPALATDQRGLPRNRDGNAIAGALPDIGAYEVQLAPVALGFNFNGASPRDLAPTDRAGGPEFAQTDWNNLTGVSGNSFPTARTVSGGGSVTVRTDWTAPNIWQFGATPATADEKLMRGYLDSNGAANSGSNLNDIQNQPFFALADLPPSLTLGGYKVVVYADTDTSDNRTAGYWLTTYGPLTDTYATTDLSPRLFLKDSANFSGTYTRIPASSTGGATAAAGNYLVFENQTQPAFILRAEEFSGPQLRAVINAVQVVRNELLVVTTATDENDPVGTAGAGLSLREAIALAPAGGGITFDSSLSGQTLTLSPTFKDITITKNVTIDASNLAGGLTLSGGNGTGNVAGNNLDGGAIYNGSGTLTLTQCTLSGNSATSGFGGAIYNASGTLTLTQSTLSGNSAASGSGAIYNSGTLTLTQSTLSGNSATFGSGGAIYNSGTLTLTQSTLSGNSATFGGGGAIYNSGTLTLTNNILASGSPDIYNGTTSSLSGLGFRG